MTHTPHEPAEEFHDHAERIHDLMMSNDHFRKLAFEYHELNREIGRMRTDVASVTTVTEEETRKRRLALNAERAAYLRDDTQG